jgi:hypothetical protein
MSNRQWLKQLAATETKTWMSAVTPLGLDGTLRLETRHTIYVFRDGVCVDVARRGEDEVSGELTMIGMRVVGWLMEVEGSRRLLPRWIPGARAVLFRPPTDILPTRIALTSTSYRFVPCSQTDEVDDEAATVRIPPSVTQAAASAAASASFVRVFP